MQRGGRLYGEDDSENGDGDEDVGEEYPGDNLPHPALESKLGVFIDPAYDDALKQDIWNNQGDDLFNYEVALQFWTAVFDGTAFSTGIFKAEANFRLFCQEWWENKAYDSD